MADAFSLGSHVVIYLVTFALIFFFPFMFHPFVFFFLSPINKSFVEIFDKIINCCVFIAFFLLCLFHGIFTFFFSFALLFSFFIWSHFFYKDAFFPCLLQWMIWENRLKQTKVCVCWILVRTVQNLRNYSNLEFLLGMKNGQKVAHNILHFMNKWLAFISNLKSLLLITGLLVWSQFSLTQATNPQ